MRPVFGFVVAVIAGGAITLAQNPPAVPKAAAAGQRPSALEPGFTSLFNGKDFTGWKIGGPAETFKIEDGAIVANGAASHAFYDGPFRNHSFRNFELKVDLMTRAGSNGGV